MALLLLLSSNQHTKKEEAILSKKKKKGAPSSFSSSSYHSVTWYRTHLRWRHFFLYKKNIYIGQQKQTEPKEGFKNNGGIRVVFFSTEVTRIDYPSKR